MLLKQAEEKRQQAKALIQREKALRNEEVSHEHAEKGDKNRSDRQVLAADVKHEGGERSQLNRQVEELEKERGELTRQAKEKAAERGEIEARIRANSKSKR